MKHARIATLFLLSALPLAACHKSEPANTDTAYAAPTNDTAAMNTSPAPTATDTTATNATSGTTVTSDTSSTTGSAKTGTY